VHVMIHDRVRVIGRMQKRKKEKVIISRASAYVRVFIFWLLQVVDQDEGDLRIINHNSSTALASLPSPTQKSEHVQ
jgi:hypothetical protein